MSYLREIPRDLTTYVTQGQQIQISTILPYVIKQGFQMIHASEDLLLRYVAPFSGYTMNQNQLQLQEPTTQAGFFAAMRKSLKWLQENLKIEIVDMHPEFVAFVDMEPKDESHPKIFFTTVIFNVLHNSTTQAEAEHAILHLFNSFFHELRHLWLRSQNLRWCSHDTYGFAVAEAKGVKITPQKLKFTKSRESRGNRGEGGEQWEIYSYGGLVNLVGRPSYGVPSDGVVHTSDIYRLEVTLKDGSLVVLPDWYIGPVVQSFLDKENPYIWSRGPLFSYDDPVTLCSGIYQAMLIKATNLPLPADIFPSDIFNDPPPKARESPTTRALGIIGLKKKPAVIGYASVGHPSCSLLPSSSSSSSFGVLSFSNSMKSLLTTRFPGTRKPHVLAPR